LGLLDDGLKALITPLRYPSSEEESLADIMGCG
jgi:hypothetical protein